MHSDLIVVLVREAGMADWLTGGGWTIPHSQKLTHVSFDQGVCCPYLLRGLCVSEEADGLTRSTLRDFSILEGTE